MPEEEVTASVSSGGATAKLDLLLDVPLEVTVEIGRTQVALGELLQLGPGSVVRLGKAVGEPLDVFVNGKPVARGEAVMVNDRFAIRLTEVVSPSERMNLK